MKKRERLQSIIGHDIEKERKIIRKKYTLYHPMVKLFESNMKRISNNKVLMNGESFNLIKRLDDNKMRFHNNLQPDFLEFTILCMQKVNKLYPTNLYSKFIPATLL
eukprot:TRINITY_DN7960_c0_g1_i5.p4 TRINITY_DN7960_c0_g1~~TRINITY_DN7960_c0_g1_i5.p4  ORF type:complete len:106 (+),score=11.31 TRINITY_DN7960_c0_g1_i5:649-966(+)